MRSVSPHLGCCLYLLVLIITTGAAIIDGDVDTIVNALNSRTDFAPNA